MDLNQILKEELEKIKPSKEYISSIKSKADEVVKKLSQSNITAIIGGSLAKGTLVKSTQKQDIDIFLVFEDESQIKKLGEKLKKIKLNGRVKTIHGSRDYFQIEKDNLTLELVPVLKDTDPKFAENVTDISLNHVKYITSKIKKNPEISDEILLSKHFFKANKIYGAESYIKGFSGYSLEVLTIYFGSFINLLKNLPKKYFIDPEKLFKNEAEANREINTSKLTGPILLIDPTYKYRNISAGLGKETFEKFKILSKEFLKRPSKDFFTIKQVDFEKLKSLSLSKKARLLSLDLSTDRQEGNIAGTKMKKLLDFFIRELNRKGQEVLISEFEYSNTGKNAKAYIIVKENSEILVKGPPVKMNEAVKFFRKDKTNTFEKRGIIYSKEKITVEEILNHVQKTESDMGARIKLSS